MMTVESRNNTLVDFDPFSGDVIEKIFSATEPQKEIFASCMLGGQDANLAYNESLTVYFTGKLNLEALRESIFDLQLRHESFRATFTEDGSRMIIYESRQPQHHYQDLEHLDTASQQALVDKFLKDDAATAFDLFNGPLVRTTLFRLNAEHSVLVISAHHIVCDGWSCGILLEDLSRLYNAKCSGTLPPPNPLLFSDYLKRSVEYEQSAEYRAVLKYWKDEYKGRVPVFEIPPDFPRPPLRTYKARRDDFILDFDIAEAAKKTGAKYGCGFVTTLMSVFEVLLYKYTGNSDIVVGLPTAGQGVTEMYDLIGHCVNFLPLRSNPDPGISFAEYLKKRKSKTLRDYEHQQFTFGTLLKELKIERDPSRIPLTPMSFNIDIGMNKQVSFNDLGYKVVLNKRIAETFEIFLNISDCEEGYEFQWSYNTRLFKPATIAGLMKKYVYLLEQINKNPEVLIGDIKLVDEHIVLNQLEHWNQTSKPLPKENVVSLFELAAISNADRKALTFQSASYSYQLLNESANQLAHYLISQGIQKGDIVGVVLERGPQVLIALLAVLKCGAGYLPIDPEFPPDRISFMLEDSKAPFVLVNTSGSEKLSALSSRKINIEKLRSDIQSFKTSNPNAPIGDNDLAYLLYTSGSTGKPKGVMVSHINLLNLLTGVRSILKTGTHTRLLSVTTVSFDIAALELFLPVISGGHLVMADAKTAKNGEMILSSLKKEQINLLQATPVTYKMMLEAGWSEKLPLTVISGGEALSKNLAARLLEKVEAVFNMYGPTETTIYSTATQVFPTDEVITIGKPIQNTQVYILDEHKNVVEQGQEGEIYIGGKGVAGGYHNRPELTAEKFIANPFSSEAGSKLYRTGDLGRYTPDGNIICLGRTDTQAKIRGYRIELEEIEHYISKLEGIKDAVVKVEGAEGDGQKLVAYIVPLDLATLNGGAATKDEIVSWRKELSRSLPDYMIPNAWLKLKELPLTPNKKVDRKALKYNPAPAADTAAGRKKNADLATIINKLRNIWEDEIGIQGITPEDDFFELGGHSMVAIKVMSRIEKETGARLPISALFENATIKSLADVIYAHKNINFARVVIPIKPTGTKRPIFMVHAGGLNVMLYKSLSQHLDEDQPLYGLQGLGMDGDITHLKNIESIAKRYLSELLEYDAEGPYIILGYSFGGIIAFEMVKQLLAMGKEIKMLGILDTDAFTNDNYDSKLELYTVKILRQFKKIGFYTRQLLTAPQDFFKYQWIYLKKRITNDYSDPGIINMEIYDYEKEVIEAYQKAFFDYRLKPIDADIDLFKIDHKPVYFINVDATYYGWKKYTTKDVKTHIVPGDHFTILLPPHNVSLARSIQDVLNKEN